jgi:hypothetical protein
MQPKDAQSQRVTVKQAAELLAVTPEAVRVRLFRGTLEREEGDDGTVYVRLHANQLRSGADQSGAQAPLAPYLERCEIKSPTCGSSCMRQTKETGGPDASSRP